jgi:hypothetical protein
MTVPHKVISPRLSGDPQVTSLMPQRALRLWRLPANPASRSRAYWLIASKVRAEFPYRKYPPRRTAQEPVQFLHDPFLGQQQPLPVGDLPDPVAGVLGRLARGPAGKETDPAGLDRAPGTHPPVMEAEKIKTLGVLVLGQVHDPGLGLLKWVTP